MSQGMASSIEPYRKGTSFGDWADRLAYTFDANDLSAAKRKSHFMNLCGPFVYSQLKLCYRKDELDSANYDEIVVKLKQKLDKTEPDLVHRFRFSHRAQQPDESAEDFVQAVKLQAEFCGFGEFKNVAIQDRVLAGLRDEDLKQLLLKEESLIIEKMDKLITTWNIAKNNEHTFNNNSNRFVQQSYYPYEQRVNQIRRPIQQRLGFPTNNNLNRDSFAQRNNAINGVNKFQHNNSRRINGYNNRNNYNNGNGRNNFYRFKHNYADMICDHCWVNGHIKRKCFALKNLKRDAVKFVDTTKPGTSGEQQLISLLGKMTTTDSDDDFEEWNPGELECMHIGSVNKISEPCLINVLIENIIIKMEVDCGSTVTVMGKNKYYNIFRKPLNNSNKQLQAVNGYKLKVEGEKKCVS
ncbi:uncharacterized protein LOC129764660 [Toxorhynchites rutilus septentrionalis]|uniref:uncharacterized protein LOC129764660 n=1 Tax=Toxorhynchites rutilus septentrionalis TaxID=329112 RepID=UPI0024793B22|nr:uncharacterized protein LOC129764660 [Toxorhynchites rutilus septentrionalis]XP_055619951.1 uncharacterized protein LOC129764660 [Toxorhynchites rutilus septentrionalis]XP_055619952.1 uncharacterized protein LOC129764660 [Toxorhynchites rutilus septentrionalis]